MKDYTKYDFSAIVGAEVELQVKYFGCYKGKVLCRWEHEGKPYLTILVCKSEGSHLCDIPVDEIVPDSLSARIKVEDATLQQLKKHFQLSHTDSLVFDNDRVFSCYIIEGELEDVYDGVFVHDYIDCTDWGWKDE